MNRAVGLQSLRAALSGEQFKVAVVLLVSPLLAVTWKYFGSPEFYLANCAATGPGGTGPSAAPAVYSFLACFVLLAVVPALIVKLVFRQRLADYGMQLGDRVRTVRSFLVFAPVMLLVAWLSSQSAAMTGEYPIDRTAGSSASAFALHTLTYLFFYAGWEFHFRGFLQFGLRKAFGDAGAILVAVLASVLLHLGKPAAETYGAIAAGLLWGILAFRTRSVLSGFLQHALLGISLDWFIAFG